MAQETLEQNVNSHTHPTSTLVPAIQPETFICLVCALLFFCGIGYVMGVKNMFATMMGVAYSLIVDVLLFIMGLTVLTGAICGLLGEFGVIALFNKLLSPLMRPIYNLPGAGILAGITCFLSDNPAVAGLGKEKSFIKYFTLRERSTLTNFGSAYGMGLIVITYMLGISAIPDTGTATLAGFIGAVAGSIISTRLMSIMVTKHYGPRANERVSVGELGEDDYDIFKVRKRRPGTGFDRCMGGILDGGKNGVTMCMDLIPGLVSICTIVKLLTNSAGPGGVYTGAATEGVGLLPYLAGKIDFILQPLYGFTSPEAIAFPCTALGSVGAALGLVPGYIEQNLISANDIAVFVAIGMTWSGYLTAHVAMMDALGSRELAGKAIISHTIAGLCAGVVAHWLFVVMV